jgi:N-acetyl sugar amidotransferase
MDNPTPYQICTRCVMDTSDPEITFDAQGHCNHCRYFFEHDRPTWFPNEEGARRWAQWIERIKREGRGREYDCIIGISGGVDSAYMAYRLSEYGLRMLAVHVDGGWNSEIAVKNIEMLVKKLNIDLFTYVVDWDEMRDLQLAFLKASLANQDVPQDHAFFAQLYRQAMQHRIRYFLSGGNLATESILPGSWGYNAMDSGHLAAIHKRFGTRPLRTFPRVSFWTLYGWAPFVRRYRTLRPLNFMDYNKPRAKQELAEKFGWRDYGDKHHESRFTKFFQSYYLPVKFGYDKRRAHLSSMIVAGQISREESLEILRQPPYDAAAVEEDKIFVAKKLGISAAELQRLIDLPPCTYRDYPSNAWLFDWKDRVMRRLRQR